MGSADIQSLADLAGGHDVLREMRVFPFSRQSFIALAVVIALPYLPLTLTMLPFEDMVSTSLPNCCRKNMDVPIFSPSARSQASLARG